MQLNTTTALITALFSAVIGFGMAFYIERKLSSNMQWKSQKILTSIAMFSFGYGLMATLNEVVGFPVQGLQTRCDKLFGYILANMLFLPIVLLVIAKLIGLKNKVEIIGVSVQTNSAGVKLFKYFLMLVGGLLTAYLGYIALEGGVSLTSKYSTNNFPASTSPVITSFDFYTKVDFKNCNSSYETSPINLKFSFKRETNEIFMIQELLADGVKKQNISKLENCSILDEKNWSCGGQFIGPYMTPKYTFVGGELSYDNGTPVLKDDANCPVKIVKR